MKEIPRGKKLRALQKPQRGARGAWFPRPAAGTGIPQRDQPWGWNFRNAGETEIPATLLESF
jgi:hypothetical protein